MRRLRLIIAIALCVTIPAGAGIAAERTLSIPALWHKSLPAPYDTWNVAVTPSPKDGNQLTLEFDSAILHRRTTSLVWLPSAYADDPSTGFPVAYFLHGQANINTFGVGENAYARGVSSPVPQTSPASSRSDALGIDFPDTSAARDFLVVAIDMGDPAWCGHCFWTNGVGAGVDAERYLLEEVIPLVQALFHVRTDRGGRAIFGNSMGADGALIVGFRHPDLFGFVGGLSPTFVGFRDPALFHLWANTIWSMYTGDQGWGPPSAEEVRYRALDPLTVADDMIGTGVQVMVANGDGCLPNTGQGECAQEPVYGNPQQELAFRTGMNIWTTELTQAGVRFTNIQREGGHTSALNRDNFVRFFMPAMNKVFQQSLPLPSTFSYSTIDTSFSIFGWSITVTRPNLEFLHILGAATDGSQITLAGTGTVHLTTPPLPAGHNYVAEITPDGGATSIRPVTLDQADEATLTVSLGPTRTQNETEEGDETGTFQFPHTEIDFVRQ